MYDIYAALTVRRCSNRKDSADLIEPSICFANFD